MINGDTLIAFKPKQVTKMNVIIVKYDECKELNQSLEEENILLMEQNDVLNSQKENLTEQNKNHQQIHDEQGNQIDILTNENKKKDKRIKLLKKSRTLFTIGGVIVGGVITYGVTLLLN